MTSSSISNALSTLALVGILALTGTARAGTTGGYRQSNLVSDIPGAAHFTDTNLLNPWGILADRDGQLIVADNHANAATLYQRTGRPLPLFINVSAATDLALNQSERSFMISKGRHKDESILIFATEEGTIAGWNPSVNRHAAIVAVDNSGAGAIYKGMVLAHGAEGPHLYAANFGQGVVEVYDRKFALVKSFTDPDLAAAGFVPFGIRLIQGRLFVTFAFKSSPSDDDETGGPGLGYVDEFDLHGNPVKRIASQGTLNAPWGLALAPRSFGEFGGALLVGNFGDGAINAYNPRTGEFLGQLTDAQDNVLRIPGLWGLAFRAGSDEPSLYFTAGPNDENDGLLGVLTPVDRSHH